MELLRRTGVSLAGKHVVVLGRSLIVGKPAALLAVQRNQWANATVTICHSQTPDIASFTRQADVLIAAIGKAEFVTADMVKLGAVIIDVGVSRVPDATKKTGTRLAGDVHFPSVSKVCSKITPMPETGLLLASFRVTDRGFANAVPIVALCGVAPELALIEAGAPARLVREKFTVVSPGADAATEYGPAVLFAVNETEATPDALVRAVMEAALLLNNPEAPKAGAVNVTLTPATGLLLESLAVTCN